MGKAFNVIKEKVEKALESYAKEAGIDISLLPEVIVEKPRHEELGDWATPVAMQCAKVFRKNPKEIAEKIVSKIDKGDVIGDIRIDGPGFINFFMSQKWLSDVVVEVLKQKKEYGKSDIGKGKKVQVEFVSANPTGPLHVGHGRGAAVGDSMASILEFVGWEVEREYYINDAGLQMELLGKSTQSRYFELLGKQEEAPFPEDGYKGDYIYDIAKQIIEEYGEKFLKEPLEKSLPFFIEYTKDVILKEIKKDLEDFGVVYDVWFSEKSLYERGLIDETIAFLRQKGYIYDKDGAVWFKSTAFGDEKDRVLIRSNGAPTYFASDIAYHKDKYDRGFDLVIDVWGADHHGYVPRMKAAVTALGQSPDSFHVILIQFVTLLRAGKKVSMSTRAGEFVTLRDILDEVGKDAARFFYLTRRSDSHLEFDLELAKSQTSENPVFYVQYAHARIKSLFKEAKDRNIYIPDVNEVDFDVLSSLEEQALIKYLEIFPEEVLKSAQEYAPHRIAFYLYELASRYHRFYNNHRILASEDPLRSARLLLSEAVRIVLNTGLNLLGVSAPDRM